MDTGIPWLPHGWLPWSYSNPDALHGGHLNHNGYLLYPVEARCGSLKCPPYTEGRELVCAVCSKI